MTGRQLKAYRESKGLSQIQVAEKLRDVTHATVSRWEGLDTDIPQWAAEKLLHDITLELPLQELHELLNIGAREGKDFLQLLQAAVRAYIAQQKRDGVLSGAIDEAMKVQTEKSKQLLERSPEPPALHVVPSPDAPAAGAGESHASRKRAQGH